MNRINWPNRLTLGRIVLAPIFLGLLAWRIAAINYRANLTGVLTTIVLLIAVFSDWLDGYLARRFKQTSSLGIFLDPIADKLLVIPPLILLSSTGAISIWAVIIIVSRELIVSALRLLASGRGVALAAGLLGKAKTVSEYVVLLVFAVSQDTYGVFSSPTNRLGAALAWVSALLAIISAVEYFVKNRSLLQEIFMEKEKQSGKEISS